MRTADFDYDLPKNLIAQKPASPRDSSRLLVYSRSDQTIQHRIFHELPEILQSGDVLVINDTKVIPARLRTLSGKEVFLVKKGQRIKDKGQRKNDQLPMTNDQLEKHTAYSQKNDQSEKKLATRNSQLATSVWQCLVRGGKYFQTGSKFEIGKDFSGEVLEVLSSGERVIQFYSKNFAKDLEKYGASPLPPYINQETKKVPQYQTTYAKKEGSVAAPTAGLHFTPRVFKKLKERGVIVEKITLHVGLGTFAPVKTEKIEDHPMHAEFFELPEKVAQWLNKYKQAGRRIIAVGSTSCRVLESCADPQGRLQARSGETSIFIYPGYKFKFIDGMLTNFHLPKSTLIMLIAALIGREKVLELYELAKQKNYRFYSFGDAMLLL